MAIGFMSFGGMLTGGDEETKTEDKSAAIEVIKEDIKKEDAKLESDLEIAENTNK